MVNIKIYFELRVIFLSRCFKQDGEKQRSLLSVLIFPQTYTCPTAAPLLLKCKITPLQLLSNMKKRFKPSVHQTY